MLVLCQTLSWDANILMISSSTIFTILAGRKKKAWELTAAISGAHTIGHAKPENSGYDGFWGDPHNQNIFNNDYFKNIMAHGWGADLAVKSPSHPEGNPNKNQWKIVDEIGSHEKGR